MRTGAAAVSVSSGRWTDFLALTKPRLNSLVVVTAGVGYLAGQSGDFNPVTFLNATVGALLVAGGAAALNQAAEHDIDQVMPRTRNRPLPAGRLQSMDAVAFGLVLIVGGLAQLAVGASLSAAIVALATLTSYVVIYTPLKRVSHWAALVGAVPGALPVVIGWAAVAPIDLGAWSLFSVVFIWQLPHFLALTWMYRDDFAQAGLPLLSVVDPTGRRTSTHLLVYCALLIPVSLMPTWAGVVGIPYAIGAGGLTAGLFGLGIWFTRERSIARARTLFRATLLYLPLIWTLLLVDIAGQSTR